MTTESNARYSQANDGARIIDLGNGRTATVRPTYRQDFDQPQVDEYVYDESQPRQLGKLGVKVAKYVAPFALSAGLVAGVGYGAVHTIGNALPFHSDSQAFNTNPVHDVGVIVDGDKFVLSTMGKMVGK